MRLDYSQQTKFDNYSNKLLNNKDVLKMKGFIQHGKISTYEHSIDVTKTALYLNTKLKLNADEKTIVEAGLLHDFYLYDWHNASVRVPLLKMHGFTHAKTAANNARNLLKVDDKICQAIESHMWPLNLFAIPKSKEAWLLCIADKICATKETVNRK